VKASVIMMKYTPLVRTDTAPMTSATSADAAIATPHWTNPFWTPW
jgi:hypothetical protein